MAVRQQSIMKVSELHPQSGWKNNTANASILYWLDCWENEHRKHLSAQTDNIKDPNNTPYLLVTLPLSDVKHPMNISG